MTARFGCGSGSGRRKADPLLLHRVGSGRLMDGRVVG
jgi:hypothetical protein